MTTRKGIVLAGGTGTRLYPITQGVSKQLLPVYDKPMVYYPISVLMLAGIRDILIITTPEDRNQFEKLLGNGGQFGVRLSYAVQARPEGIAQAFIVAEDFIQGHPVCLVLGDNLFHGQGFSEQLKRAAGGTDGATIFCYQVKNPERFGVVEFSPEGSVLGIEEKPKKPKSQFVVTGLYFYDQQVCELARQLTPSARNELEITCLNNAYLAQNALRAERLGRGFVWLDAGTHESLLEAGQYIQTIEHRQGLKVACLEEIAWHNGWIDTAALLEHARFYGATGYGHYLRSLAGEGTRANTP